MKPRDKTCGDCRHYGGYSSRLCRIDWNTMPWSYSEACASWEPAVGVKEWARFHFGVFGAEVGPWIGLAVRAQE